MHTTATSTLVVFMLLSGRRAAAFASGPRTFLKRSPSIKSTNILRTSSGLSSTSSDDSGSENDQQHLVLIGGGHAHVQVLKALHKSSRPSHLDVTLIDVQARASYSGMVPGALAGKYTPRDTELELEPLTKWAGINFINKAVVDVDLDKKLIYVEEVGKESRSKHPTLLERFENDSVEDFPDENIIPFDAVSIDIGSTSRGVRDTPGAKQFTIPTRPISALVRQFADATKEIQSRSANDEPVNVIVIGGGVAGIELSMSVHGRWHRLVDEERLNIRLLDAGDRLLPSESSANRQAVLKVLKDRNISIEHQCRVHEVTKDCVIVDIDGSIQHLPFSHCIWATGADAHDLAFQLGQSPTNDRPQRPLELSKHGWIRVKRTLQSVTHPYVFAAGDCCELIQEYDDESGMKFTSPPKAGVYAVRSGPILIENLVGYLESMRTGASDASLKKYFPQDDFLKLIGCGEGVALGFRFGVPLYGRWVWQLKDAIDNKFMDLFREKNLPVIKPGKPYDTSQYDAVYDDRPPPLSVKDAAALLQRTDDGVNYEQAWFVLRDMVDDDKYREQVLSLMTATIDRVECVQADHRR